MTGFVRHASLNCYADHGAQDLAHNNHADVDYLVVADAGACATACTEVLGCTGFVITLSQVASSTTSSYECYLRSGIILSDCDHAEAFEVHTLIPPPFPPPLPPLPPNPPLPPPRVITADVIQTLFDADGLLVHGFTGAYKSLLMSAQDRASIPLDADCGERCSAFGFLHPELPLGVYGIGLPGWEGGWFTVHRAGEADGWRAVECAAVVDSNSGNRACCACYESEFCPWQGSINWRDSGYCHDACHDYTNASEVCKALAAGCGANLRDMSRGDRYRTLPYYDEMEASATRTSTYASVQQCDASVISSGQCELCRQPVWCVDNNGRGPFDSSPISTAQAWIDAYEDGWGETIQDAQCKFQRGQKRLFIDASVAHWSAQQRSFDHWTPRWNEVNVFIEEASQEVLMDSLVGLFHVNGDGSELLSVADHLSTISLLC